MRPPEGSECGFFSSQPRSEPTLLPPRWPCRRALSSPLPPAIQNSQRLSTPAGAGGLSSYSPPRRTSGRFPFKELVFPLHKLLAKRRQPAIAPSPGLFAGCKSLSCTECYFIKIKNKCKRTLNLNLMTMYALCSCSSKVTECLYVFGTHISV